MSDVGFARFPVVRFEAEAEHIFSPLLSSLYFPSIYLAEDSIKVI